MKIATWESGLKNLSPTVIGTKISSQFKDGFMGCSVLASIVNTKKPHTRIHVVIRVFPASLVVCEGPMDIQGVVG